MLNDKLKEIMQSDSIYQEIIDNVLNNKNLKSELISEITLYMLENKEKVELVIKEGYFKYWFIRTVTNQVKSSTSPFYRNNVMKLGIESGSEGIEYLSDYLMDDNDSIQQKIDIEEKIERINKERDEIKCNWFDREMFTLYYDKGYTYRQIEKEFNIDHVLAFHSVTKLRKELKNRIKNDKK